MVFFEIVKHHKEIFEQPSETDQPAVLDKWPYHELLSRLDTLRNNGIHNPDYLLNSEVIEVVTCYLEALHTTLESTPKPMNLDKALAVLQTKVSIIANLPSPGKKQVSKAVYAQLNRLVTMTIENFVTFTQYPEPSLQFINANIVLFDISECYEWIKAVREFQPYDKLPANLQQFTTLEESFCSELKELRNNFAHINLSEIERSEPGEIGSFVWPKIKRIVEQLSALFPDKAPDNSTAPALSR
jgi:hypothetical protein